METPYSRITEIKEAGTPEEANGLLRDGYTLIKVMEKYTNDTERQFSNIVYVLGKQRSNGESRASPEQGAASSYHAAPPAIDPALLEKRPWKKYAKGGGEWAFYMDRDENLLPELTGAQDAIERMKAGEELTVGNYTYRIKDKFLKRFPVDSTQE
jgi:hypothetical protein